MNKAVNAALARYIAVSGESNLYGEVDAHTARVRLIKRLPLGNGLCRVQPQCDWMPLGQWKGYIRDLLADRAVAR